MTVRLQGAIGPAQVAEPPLVDHQVARNRGGATLGRPVRDDARVLRLSKSRDRNRNWSEPYIMAPLAYGNHYVGLVSMLDYIDGSDFVAGGGNLELAFSHDGLSWARPVPGMPAIERQPGNELFPCYAAIQPPLPTGPPRISAR